MYLIGNGIDIHKLIEYDKKINQKLAGVEIATKYKVDAHSDGDLILHAICDAILGALGHGDIGDHFPDNLEVNKNMNSELMLQHVLNLMDENKFKINNIDITIISDHIIISEYKYSMRLKLIHLLKTKFVSLKATRWEEDKKFIQCNCVVLLKTKI